MSHREFDTLIIGQGLAGSALAWHLIHAGQRVCVIDDGHRSSSSRVAAGLINPLAGMRFNRRPEVTDWLRTAASWYADITPVCGQTVYHPIPMLRVFRSAEQRRFHQRRRDDPLSRELLDETFPRGACPEPIVAPYGGFIQHHTGYVDMPRVLDGLADWLIARNALLRQPLDLSRLRVDAQGITLETVRARRVVFCEGARLRFNPWFRELPLAPDKGEILDLQCANWQPRHIINGAHWLVPLHGGGIRMGSTHEHHKLDDRVTARGHAQLLKGLDALAPGMRMTVTAHQAGIRPATSDRHPLLGRHARDPALWVCNGFGARGALSIPWYTQRLASHLVTGTPLPVEADITRFA